MVKKLAIFGFVLLMAAASAPAAFAGQPIEICLGPICIIIGGGSGHGGGGGKPAPAPLLAAGIPAFTALGGGLLFTKLRRRFQTKSPA